MSFPSRTKIPVQETSYTATSPNRIAAANSCISLKVFEQQAKNTTTEQSHHHLIHHLQSSTHQHRTAAYKNQDQTKGLELALGTSSLSEARQSTKPNSTHELVHCFRTKPKTPNLSTPIFLDLIHLVHNRRPDLRHLGVELRRTPSFHSTLNPLTPLSFSIITSS
ncbi:hypothetical protein Droror1_Dr00011284 [Drosera rotundifolia]